VAVTLDAWLGSLQALLPPGRALTREAGAVLTNLLQAIAAVFSRTEQDLEATQVQYDPLVATTLLPDWERLLALPDGCTIEQELSTADRQRIASQRLMEQGGQSRAYFMGLAEQLGEPDCTITEFEQATCGSNCNDALYSESDEFAWRFNVPAFVQDARPANCNDGCEVALQIYKPNLIECPIGKRKPAHTLVLFAYDSPTLDLDFTNESPDPRVTFSGGVGGTRVNSAGVIVPAVCPRINYDPVTLACKGLLFEEARTNSIRNNKMAGAVAGSPGTAPTNWNVTSTGGVVTRTIVGTGIEDGIDYVDVRYQFSGAGTAQVLPDSTTGIPAASGQFWTFSTYIKMVGGSLANLSVRIGAQERDAVGTLLQTTVRADLTSAELTGDLAAQRYEITREFMDAGTGSATGLIQVVASAGSDITLRIGLPQMELGGFATSVIATAGAAVTRTADNPSMSGTNFSDWYRQDEGTFVASWSTEHGAAAGASSTRVFALSNGSNNERLIGYAQLIQIISGGAGTGSTQSMGTGLDPTGAIAAWAYKANQGGFSKNGAAAVTDTTFTLPAALSQMNLGNNSPFTSTVVLNGHIKFLRYYPRRLSDAQLQTLTT
jgi:uncharacterized protein YmfQ (DUF2313 family)